MSDLTPEQLDKLEALLESANHRRLPATIAAAKETLWIYGPALMAAARRLHAYSAAIVVGPYNWLALQDTDPVPMPTPEGLDQLLDRLAAAEQARQAAERERDELRAKLDDLDLVKDGVCLVCGLDPAQMIGERDALAAENARLEGQRETFRAGYLAEADQRVRLRAENARLRDEDARKTAADEACALAAEAEIARLRAALAPFASGGDWGVIKAFIVAGSEDRAIGIEMAAQLTRWQVAADAALDAATEA